MKKNKNIILFFLALIFLLLVFNNFEITSITFSSFIFTLLIFAIFLVPYLFVTKKIFPYIFKVRNIYFQVLLKILLAILFAGFLKICEYTLIKAFPNEISYETSTSFLFLLVMMGMLFLYETPKTNGKE